jgi:hypothetical protein
MRSVESSKEDKQKMLEYCLRFKDVLESYDRSKYSGVFYCGWDTEYDQLGYEYKNKYLSSQLATLFIRETVERLQYFNIIYFSNDGEQLRFKDVIKLAKEPVPDQERFVRHKFDIEHAKKAIKRFDLTKKQRLALSRALKPYKDNIYDGAVELKDFKSELRSVLDTDLWNLIKSRYIRLLKPLPFLFNLVTHYTTAEWAMLADRSNNKLLNHLQVIRKSIVTKSTTPLRLKIHGCDVEVHWFDTKLLAPGSHQSLEKLSKLVLSDAESKLPLSQKEIEHMDELLRTDPRRFIEYALRDSEVTLKVFIAMQDLLNRQVYGKFKRLFKTLGSASVEALIEHYKEKSGCPILNQIPKNNGLSPETRTLMNERFYCHLPLVEASYLGGRNEAFYRGRTSEDPTLIDYILLDLDLSSAYPTAMSLILRIDLEQKPRHTHAYYVVTDQIIKKLNLDLSDQQKKELTSIYGAKFLWSRNSAEESKSFECLQKSLKEVFRDLQPILRASFVSKIMENSLHHENSLINDWYDRWSQIRKNIPDLVERSIKLGWNHKAFPSIARSQIVGFARVVFDFPTETNYPCLAVRQEKYGLIYPLSGETYATSIEVILANEMIRYGNQSVRRCKKAIRDELQVLEKGTARYQELTDELSGLKEGSISCLEALEMPTLPDDRDENNIVLTHLVNLIRERQRYQKAGDKFGDRYIKDFVNSLYGKTAQGIKYRTAWDISKGEGKRLPESKITDAYIASLVTGSIRAALSAAMFAIEKHNNEAEYPIIPISCTTDGFLIGLHKPASISINDLVNSKGKPKPVIEVLQLLDGGLDFYKSILHQLPLLQLKHAAIQLGQSDYLEVKHICDDVLSIKTRGQIGWMINEAGEKKVSLLARCGHRAPLKEFLDDIDKYEEIIKVGGQMKDQEDARWLVDQYENTSDKIQTFPVTTLANVQTILDKKKPYDDLVNIHNDQRVNLDFDWKRKLVPDLSAGREKEGADDLFSPITRPFESLAEMLRHRKEVEKIRKQFKQKKNGEWVVHNGYKATPEKVLNRVNTPARTTRARGTTAEQTVRAFIRAFTQGKFYEG